MKLTLKATNDSLRTLLESEGFIFPCGGKGLCGRCKIVAPTLPITEKDKAFISEADLERGIRLACDKVIDGEIEIDCLLEKRATEKLKISAITVTAHDSKKQISHNEKTRLHDSGALACFVSPVEPPPIKP